MYDAPDSYLGTGASDWKGLLRGVAKFVTRQSQRLQMSYQSAVEEMCKCADAVICSTEEQRSLIEPYCENVHLILDIHTRRSPLSRLITRRARHSASFVKASRPAASRWRCCVTCCCTADDVAREFGGLARCINVYQWDSFALSQLAVAADMALIPTDLQNAFLRGEPENKFVLFWRMGVPTFTAATFAYQRAMKLAGVDMACESMADWQGRLEHLMADESARQHADRQGLRVAGEHYSAKQMLQRWDAVFASVRFILPE